MHEMSCYVSIVKKTETRTLALLPFFGKLEFGGKIVHIGLFWIENNIFKLVIMRAANCLCLPSIELSLFWLALENRIDGNGLAVPVT